MKNNKEKFTSKNILDTYENLVDYFKNTPKEKILEDWDKTAELDNIGPTVEKFLNNSLEKEFVPYVENLKIKKLGLNISPYHTYSQSFRFFREKYNLILDIVPFYDENQLPLSINNIAKPKGFFVWNYYEENFNEENVEKFETYEGAELDCLRKLIEICKNINS